MFQLVKLQYKSFFRSASMGGSLFAKIFAWIGIVYFTLMAILIGFIHGTGISVLNPDADNKIEFPFEWINENLIYAFGYWIVLRYILQKIPIVNIRQLLLTPMKKSKVIRFAVNRTNFSTFNLMSIFYLVPFSLTVYSMGDLDSNKLIFWNISIIAIVYITNYLNIVLNKRDSLVCIIAGVLISFRALEYWDFLDFTLYSKIIFTSFYNQPILVLIPIALLAYTYYSVIRFFRFGLYIDTGLQVQVAEASQGDFKFLNRFGEMAKFLRNDFRLIKRSKRARNTALMGIGFVLYGLIFLWAQDIYGDTMLVFGYLFSTGGFMFTFCGLVPSWDSQHYSFMMCQNIKYIDYLKSKWYLGCLGIGIATLLASPIYAYFGLFHFVAIICCGVYNLGLNSYLTLWAGAFTKSKVDLDSMKNAMGDSKAFNSKTLLLTIPQMVVPVVVYLVVSKFFTPMIGCFAIGILGAVGVFFRKPVFKLIIQTYKTEKYSTLSAYKETN